MCGYVLENTDKRGTEAMFFMDDGMIARNPVVLAPTLDWGLLFRTDYWGANMFDGSWTHKSFRPLTVLTFRWNYLLHGFASSGYHITNLALHLLATAMLGAFACLSLRLPTPWGALLAALFFAHPVHTESLLTVVGRADLLCLIFILLAAATYEPCLRRRRAASVRLPLAAALVVAAGLCKETGFCFFGLLAGWDVLTAIACGRRDGAARVLALLLLGAGACAWRWWYTGGATIEALEKYCNPVLHEKDPAVRAMSFMLVHGVYWKLLVWPTFLCYDYSLDAIPLVRTPEDLRLLLPLSAYSCLAMLSWLSAGALRSRSPARLVPIIGLAIFALGALPMSNLLFPVATMVGERLLYVPSAGLLLTLVGLARLAEARHGGAAWRRPSAGLLACGVAAAWLCARRVPDWASPTAITVADGEKQLRSARVQYNYASHFVAVGRYDEALAKFNLAISIAPAAGDAMPWYRAGQILLHQRQHAEAHRYLKEALTRNFTPLILAWQELVHDYALSLWFVGDAPGAVEQFRHVLQATPHFAKALNNLGCAEGVGAHRGTFPVAGFQRAVDSFVKGSQLYPEVTLFRRNLASMLRLAGNSQEAASVWAQLKAASPAAAAEAEPPSDCTWSFDLRIR